MDQLPARQPVLALPMDRGWLAARAVGAPHRRDRLAGRAPGTAPAADTRRAVTATRGAPPFPTAPQPHPTRPRAASPAIDTHNPDQRPSTLQDLGEHAARGVTAVAFQIELPGVESTTH